MSFKLHLILDVIFLTFHTSVKRKLFFCVSLRYEMSFKLHLILDVIFLTFHTSVKRRKITFNS